jgi:hypothetical protein
MKHDFHVNLKEQQIFESIKVVFEEIFASITFKRAVSKKKIIQNKMLKLRC